MSKLKQEDLTPINVVMEAAQVAKIAAMPAMGKQMELAGCEPLTELQGQIVHRMISEIFIHGIATAAILTAEGLSIEHLQSLDGRDMDEVFLRLGGKDVCAAN